MTIISLRPSCFSCEPELAALGSGTQSTGRGRRVDLVALHRVDLHSSAGTSARSIDLLSLVIGAVPSTSTLVRTLSSESVRLGLTLLGSRNSTLAQSLQQPTHRSLATQLANNSSLPLVTLVPLAHPRLGPSLPPRTPARAVGDCLGAELGVVPCRLARRRGLRDGSMASLSTQARQVHACRSTHGSHPR